MADTYKEYLAARVLNDSRPVTIPLLTNNGTNTHFSKVTYRLLSRALKVNVNIAKQYVYSSTYFTAP
jgi:DNA polymerase delta subunit 3